MATKKTTRRGTARRAPVAGRKAPATRQPPQSRSGWQLRPNDGQGPFTKYFQSFIPRKVEATFYEFLREAIPFVDTAINSLVALDGIIKVAGDNDTLVDEIKEWMYNVPVNDIQRGLQAYHQSISNEAFEQGFGLGEYVPNRQRNDIIGLRTADSKFIKFQRTTSGLNIYQKADDDLQERPLNPASLQYFSIYNENQNPYGTPQFRSCEFVCQILATIDNALMNVWQRFGDPSFSVIYKTSAKDGSTKGNLAARRQTLEEELNTAVRAKRAGQSADFVRAIDKDSEIEIKVIGHEGQILELEVPSRHVNEQIIAKSDLPPLLFGVQWSTTERMGTTQTELLSSKIQTRQAAKMPLFYNLIRTLLLLRGRTWKKGDWWLEWQQVNLHDLVAQAQARFLNAQADMYYLQKAAAAGITIDIGDLAIGKVLKNVEAKVRAKDLSPLRGTCTCGAKELHRPTPWPELDKVESNYETVMKDKWTELANRIMTILKLSDSKAIGDRREAIGKSLLPIAHNPLPEGAKGPDDLPGLEAFQFTAEQRTAVMKAYKDWIGEFAITAADSPLLWVYGEAYSLGLIQAAKLIGKDRPILDIIKNKEIFDDLCKNGFNLVKENATKAIIQNIMPEMEAQMLAGTNPRHVADRLNKLFGAANSDWERLARSEMSMAAESAKLDEWAAWKVKMVEFTPAPDACPICISLRDEYKIGQCPLPVRDTHPRCRCSTRPAESET